MRTDEIGTLHPNISVFWKIPTEVERFSRNPKDATPFIFSVIRDLHNGKQSAWLLCATTNNPVFSKGAAI
jgi:hypothetical protein